VGLELSSPYLALRRRSFRCPRCLRLPRAIPRYRPGVVRDQRVAGVIDVVGDLFEYLSQRAVSVDEVSAAADLDLLGTCTRKLDRARYRVVVRVEVHEAFRTEHGRRVMCPRKQCVGFEVSVRKDTLRWQGEP